MQPIERTFAFVTVNTLEKPSRFYYTEWYKIWSIQNFKDFQHFTRKSERLFNRYRLNTMPVTGNAQVCSNICKEYLMIDFHFKVRDRCIMKIFDCRFINISNCSFLFSSKNVPFVYHSCFPILQGRWKYFYGRRNGE